MLTREKVFALNDITTKVITIPDNIPVWGGESLIIKQLSRGQQDNYNVRRFGKMEMQQETKAKNSKQDIKGVSIFGHDAWLVVCGVVNEDGSQMFTHSDEAELNKKSGEAIGWIASEIVKFSGMQNDEAALSEEEEVKN